LLVLSSPPLPVWWDGSQYPYGNNMGWLVTTDWSKSEKIRSVTFVSELVAVKSWYPFVYIMCTTCFKDAVVFYASTKYE
jgi:hypothetical protein